MEDEDLKIHPIYLIGTRNVLLMGCERRLLLFTATLIVAVAYALQSVVGLIGSIIAFVVALSLLRKMAKYDPQLSSVVINSRRFKNRYLAHATHFGLNYRKYK